MHLYTLHQWLLLFYLYCFVGWIWESFYVSLKKHKWVNRGFLKGPLLPIYGSGAIVVLISTITIRNNLILVFIVGMISATILEYITGSIMEKLFKVRYWDYSEKPFNINGHICLIASLAWGIFSIILVEFANPPIEEFVVLIPNEIVESLSYILTVFITIDGVQEFNHAIDLKNILIRITERNETVAHIGKRLEGVEAFINKDVKSLKEKLIEKAIIKQEKKLSRSETRKKAVEEIIRSNLVTTEKKIKDLSERVTKYIEKFDDVSYKAIAERNYLKDEFIGYLNRLRKHESRIQNTENKVYINCIDMLRRNPGAKSKKYEEAIKEVKDLDKEIDDK